MTFNPSVQPRIICVENHYPMLLQLTNDTMHCIFDTASLQGIDSLRFPKAREQNDIKFDSAGGVRTKHIVCQFDNGGWCFVVRGGLKPMRQLIGIRIGMCNKPCVLTIAGSQRRVVSNSIANFLQHRSDHQSRRSFSMRTHDSDRQHPFTRLASQGLAKLSIRLAYVGNDALRDTRREELLRENCLCTTVDGLNCIACCIRFDIQAYCENAISGCLINASKACTTPNVIGTQDLCSRKKLPK